MSTSTHSEEQQQPNGYPGKSKLMPNGKSHESQVTSNNTGSSCSECGVCDETFLAEGQPPFLKFVVDMNQNSAIVPDLLDPSNQNGIPFIDDCFIPAPSESGQEFDPELFDSILTTGNDILARLESTSSTGGSVTSPIEVTVEEGRGGGVTGEQVEWGSVAQSGELSGQEPDFDDFIRGRVLSTIIEDGVEGGERDEGEDEDSDYIHLDNIQTSLPVGLGILPPLPKLHSTQPHPQSAPEPHPQSHYRPRPKPRQNIYPQSTTNDTTNSDPDLTNTMDSTDIEVFPIAPLRSSSLRDSADLSEALPADTSTVLTSNREESDLNASSQRSTTDISGHTTPVNFTSAEGESDINPTIGRGDGGISEESTSLQFTSEGAEGGKAISGKVEDRDNLEHDSQATPVPPHSSSDGEDVVTSREDDVPTPTRSESGDNVPSSSSRETQGTGSEGATVGEVRGVALVGGNERSTSAGGDIVVTGGGTTGTALIVSPPPEENTEKDIPSSSSPGSRVGVVSPEEHSSLSSSSSPPSSRLESSLDTGGSPRRRRMDSSDLDKGQVRRTASNAVTSPVLRSKSPHTPTRRPSSEMVVLQPLSPDHGTDLTRQYEFLRRTLSHSQRRYSQRGKHPREGKGRGQGGRGQAKGGTGHGQTVHVANGSVASRPGASGGGRGQSATSEETRQKQTIGQLRAIVRESERSSPQVRRANENLETHVDQHGRTYYMDHSTRTIAFDRTSDVSPQQQEMQTRREMLDRRYQSLQRSFRRSERPTVNVRNRSSFFTSSRTPNEHRTENNSLSLTLAEAEEMARSLSRSKPKKQRSSSGKSGRWFFSRKSKSNSITQQQESSSDDNIIAIEVPPSSDENSSQLEPISDSSITRSSESGSDSSTRNQNENEIASTTVAVGSSMASVSSSDREMTPASILSSEFESGTEDESVRRSNDAISSQEVVEEQTSPAERSGQAEVVQEQSSQAEGVQERSSQAEGVQEQSSQAEVVQERSEGVQEQSSQAEVVQERSSQAEGVQEQSSQAEVVQDQSSQAEIVPGQADERSRQTERSGQSTSGSERTHPTQVGNVEVSSELSNSSLGIGLRERQTSIVHASNLSEADQSAATRARAKAADKRRNRQRYNTDELTNQEAEQLMGNVSGGTVQPSSPSSPNDPFSTTGTAVLSEPVKEKKVGSGISRGSRRKSKRSAANLATSPALRFIARKDLYSFLSSAGVAGEEFFSNRALMELVQRIRSNHTLFEKYEHSHHLVGALNKFADLHADLPDNWEKKLNKQGRVFFIDHNKELTTFIDPRLPLPDTPYTYNPDNTDARKLSEPYVRPHHTTVMTHSQSLDENVRPSSINFTVTEDQDTPTLTTPSSASSLNSSGPTLPSSNRMSTASIASVEVTPISYEDQVVAFFRQSDVVEQISQRYSRGVRPQFQVVIDAIKTSGTAALNRIQMSGSIATYELALILSLFEEEISQMRPASAQPSVPLPTSPPATSTSLRTIPDPAGTPGKGKSTLQRRKEAFPVKLQNFKMMMAQLGFVQGSRIRYNIRRDHMLEDAYEHVMKSDIQLLQKKRLNITFKGEEGLDYGGPSREFFFLLSREIFNPYYGLFEYSANDTYTIQISPTASFIHNNMEWFRFAGRVVGLVIVQGFLLDVFFTRTIYKTLLGRPPSVKDLEALEPAFYNSLLWIRDNDPEPLDLTFTVEEEAFGQLSTHELKPGGTDIPVTEDNKDEYVDLMLRWRLDRGVARQMNAFKKGFAEVLPVQHLSNFDAQELEFLTAGTLEIDVDDWKTYTEYRNGYHAAHQVVLWFWQAVEKFDNEERLRLLQFVTGTSSVPIAGFKALRGSNGPKKFTIDFYNDVQAFPRSHTCFNRIDLPPYPSFEVLYNKLHFAMTEGGGFGIE